MEIAKPVADKIKKLFELEAIYAEMRPRYVELGAARTDATTRLNACLVLGTSFGEEEISALRQAKADHVRAVQEWEAFNPKFSALCSDLVRVRTEVRRAFNVAIDQPSWQDFFATDPSK